MTSCFWHHWSLRRPSQHGWSWKGGPKGHEVQLPCNQQRHPSTLRAQLDKGPKVLQWNKGRDFDHELLWPTSKATLRLSARSRRWTHARRNGKQGWGPPFCKPIFNIHNLFLGVRKNKLTSSQKKKQQDFFSWNKKNQTALFFFFFHVKMKIFLSEAPLLVLIRFFFLFKTITSIIF